MLTVEGGGVAAFFSGLGSGVLGFVATSGSFAFGCSTTGAAFFSTLGAGVAADAFSLDFGALVVGVCLVADVLVGAAFSSGLGAGATVVVALGSAMVDESMAGVGVSIGGVVTSVVAAISVSAAFVVSLSVVDELQRINEKTIIASAMSDITGDDERFFMVLFFDN
jgi:hypothetical protein